jgi:ATP-dependent DNA helicase RecQ
MPAFLVFSNRTLEDLARKAPGTLNELEEVYGLGPQKIEVFGKELLEILYEIV